MHFFRDLYVKLRAFGCSIRDVKDILTSKWRAGKERTTRNWTLILKNSSIRSIWTYLTASHWCTTNTSCTTIHGNAPVKHVLMTVSKRLPYKINIKSTARSVAKRLLRIMSFNLLQALEKFSLRNTVPLNKLQNVQKNAARLGHGAPQTDHISPFLASLHWLPIVSRIQYGLASLC